MNLNINILRIDKQIKKHFSDRKREIPKYAKELKSLRKCLDNNNISTRSRNNIMKKITDIEEKINELNDDINLTYYIAETAPFIKQYRKILTVPIKMSFMGKSQVDNKKKKAVIQSYLSAARKYSPVDLENIQNEKKDPDKVVCNNCPNKSEFDVIDDYIYICLECGSTQEIYMLITSYKDIDRVNISQKYKYDRRVHFRDGIKQYQGKQNSTIEQKVYDDLEEQFRRHHLLVGDKDTPRKVRFSRIEKSHILLFLKELGYCKHYENFVLIHYVMTENKPDDISHLEDKLMADFDKLTELYDEVYKNIERKNFLNTQYTLYQLLKRHKHRVDMDNLNLLKTIDRLDFHDTIMRDLFGRFGWTFTSTY